MATFRARKVVDDAGAAAEQAANEKGYRVVLAIVDPQGEVVCAIGTSGETPDERPALRAPPRPRPRPGRPPNAQLWADLGDLHRRIKPDFDPTTPEARADWEQSRRAMAPAG